jgi:thiol-disulfide isomerase/thioredoxin
MTSTRGRRWGACSALGLFLLSACATPGSGFRSPASGEATSSLPPAVNPTGLIVHGRADYDWTLRRLDGERVQLEAYRGRVLFINIWASWCAPCVAEMGSIQRLRDSLRDSGVEFLLVSPEEREPVERFLGRYGYDLPVLLETEEMPAAFGLRALPTTFLVDRSGNIVLKHRGAADWDDDSVRAFLQALAR